MAPREKRERSTVYSDLSRRVPYKPTNIWYFDFCFGSTAKVMSWMSKPFQDMSMLSNTINYPGNSTSTTAAFVGHGQMSSLGKDARLASAHGDFYPLFTQLASGPGVYTTRLIRSMGPRGSRLVVCSSKIAAETFSIAEADAE